MFGALRSDRRGFTLVEILAVLVIVGVLLTFFFLFNSRFQARAETDHALKRMQQIVASVQDYYAAHEDLPAPEGADPANEPEVPVEALKLAAKYRLDPWARPIRYYTFFNDGQNGRPGEIQIDPLSPGAPVGTPPAMVIIPMADPNATPPEKGRTLIRAVGFNGRRVAGLIISSGPDQVFGFQQSTQTDASGQAFELFEPDPNNDAGQDDIFLVIDVNDQARRIALAELKVLNEKVKAFDERYVGVDNNQDGQFDENDCNAVAYPNPSPPDYAYLLRINSCAIYPQVPGGDYLPVSNEDYSCGTPTLDAMKARFCGSPWNCSNNGYYFPRIREYERVWINTDPTDPSIGDWQENTCGYIDPDYFRIPLVRGSPSPDDCHWGLVDSQSNVDETRYDQARAFIFCLNNLSPAAIVDPWLNGYIWGCGSGGCNNQYADGDPQYHRFFSAGPDGIPAVSPVTSTQTDDIIP